MFEYNETLEQARTRNIRDALLEDIGKGDWTGRLLPSPHAVAARVVVREDAVLCGRDWFEGCMHGVDAGLQIHWHYAEGACMRAHTEVCRICGDARAIFTAERSALNFLHLLSGTATITRRYVDALAGAAPHACAVLDTRKTLPGLRQAQKYAVRTGGGQNQRLALWHGILIKENHIAAAGGVAAVLKRVQETAPQARFVEIEVETLAQLREALDAGARMVLLDNMPLPMLREAVALNAGRAVLEISGGVTLDSLRALAETGVDRISVGALTKDVKATDFSMRLQELP